MIARKIDDCENEGNKLETLVSIKRLIKALNERHFAVENPFLL